MLKPLHLPVGGVREVAHDCTVNERPVSQPRSLHVPATGVGVLWQHDSATEVGVIWQVMISTKVSRESDLEQGPEPTGGVDIRSAVLMDFNGPELTVQVAQHASKVLQGAPHRALLRRVVSLRRRSAASLRHWKMSEGSTPKGKSCSALHAKSRCLDE